MHFTLMVSVWSCFTPWMLKLGNPHDVQLAGMWSGSVVPGFSSLMGMVVSFIGVYDSDLRLFNNVRKSDKEDSFVRARERETSRLSSRAQGALRCL